MGNEIIVIGSINMDMVIKTQRIPEGGETVIGEGFFINPGGKGANQAYSAAKLGGNVTMIGCIGNDLFGEQLLQNLNEVGVHTKYIKKVPNKSSGVAMITVDSNGENSIIVSPAANNDVTPEFIEAHEEVIQNSRAILLQLEIPIETVVKSIKIAKKYNVPVLLDPAPAQYLPEEVLADIDYIFPNETEIEQLTNVKVFDIDSAMKASKILINKGVNTVISKLGKDGVVICQKDKTKYIEGIKVNTVDTTGAGDAFAGAFVKKLVEGKDLISCVEYANIVGALCVTKKGTQVAVPSEENVMSFIQ